jgi:hypothetical protein
MFDILPVVTLESFPYFYCPSSSNHAHQPTSPNNSPPWAAGSKATKSSSEVLFSFLILTFLHLIIMQDDLIALYPGYARENCKIIVACDPATELFIAMAMVYPYQKYWFGKLALRGNLAQLCLLWFRAFLTPLKRHHLS